MKYTKKILTLIAILILWGVNLKAQNCGEVIEPFATCKNGSYTFSFILKNNTNWPIKGITIRPNDPNITTVSPILNGGFPFFDIVDIAPGTSSITQLVLPLYVAKYSSSACFSITFCNRDTVNGPIFGAQCCTTDSICFQLPLCPTDTADINSMPCSGPTKQLVDVYAKPADSTGNCCYKISFVNNYLPANIGRISFTGLFGTKFALTTTGSGWAYSGTPSTTYREVSALPLGVGVGAYSDFISLCITGSASSPYKIFVQYFDVNNVYVCNDTLVFEQCNLVQSQCATITNDSLYCYNNKTYFKFNIINNSPKIIQELAYDIKGHSKFIVTPSTTSFAGSSAILPGATSGDIIIEIDTINGGSDQFCIELSAFDSVHTNTTAPTTCCTDSVIFCLPFINCKLNGCCEFEEMTIPNGITPNSDKKNDYWVLVKPAKCDSIKIEVFNRWGNKVFKDNNYLNNWGGTNQGGSLLPQGTYFVIIELKNGSKKGLYVDIRY
jgi:gliding motility-associated-like protein